MPVVPNMIGYWMCRSQDCTSTPAGSLACQETHCKETHCKETYVTHGDANPAIADLDI